MTKEDYMKLAIELAKEAQGYTSPNPMVGCVVVKNGEIIATGYHEKYGGFHAERNALTKVDINYEGADLYVNLEPCCHYGKTPPCTDIIIEKKISRVFVGSMDTNPLVKGKGVEILRNHGIYVETGILEEECRKLNETFYYSIEHKIPFVAMKYAMSMDGKIAAYTGDSKWVTSEESRKDTQFLRKKYKGIMVGINTVLRDNPFLTLRMEGEIISPVRIICDSNLRIPLECNIVNTASDYRTIVACKKSINDSDCKKIKKLQAKNVEVVFVDEKAGQGIDLRKLMEEMYNRKIDGILLEGGGTLNAAMLKEKLVNKVYAYIAPKLIGGANALTPVEGEGVEKMSDAFLLSDVEIRRITNDILIAGYIKNTDRSEM